MLVGDLVRDAYLELRVIDAQSPVSAQKMQDGIRKLNQIMAQNESVGLALGWSRVEAAADTLPVPEEQENFVTLFLALSIQPRHKTQLDPLVVAGYNKALAAFSAGLLMNQSIRTESQDLPQGTGQRPGFGGWRAGYTQ